MSRVVKSPPRLIQDPSIAASLRADLAKEIQAAAAYENGASWAAVQAKIAAGAATGVKSTVLAWWIVGVSVVGGGALTTGVLTSTNRDAERLQVGIATNLDPERTSGPRQAIVPPPRSEEPPPTTSQADERATPPQVDTPPVARTRPRRQPSEARRAAPKPKAPPQADLAGEAEATNRARQALARTPHDALRLLEQADKRYPSGVFTQERRSLRVRALFATGKVEEGCRRGRAFIDTYPRSPYTRKIAALVERHGGSQGQTSNE